MKLFLSQSKIEVKRMLRNPYFIFWSLLVPIGFYFIFTRVLNIDVPDKTVWDAHFLMSIACFSVMGSSIMSLGITLAQERSEGWTKFLETTPLPASSYFGAKMVSQSIISFVSIVLIFIVGAVFNGVSLSVSEWLLCGIWIFIGSFTFLALGTIFGTMKSVATASGVSNFVYLILAITGGFWMPMDILPQFIQAIGKSLPAFHFGNGAWEIVRGNAPELINYGILALYTIVFMILSTYIRRKQEAV